MALECVGVSPQLRLLWYTIYIPCICADPVNRQGLWVHPRNTATCLRYQTPWLECACPGPCITNHFETGRSAVPSNECHFVVLNAVLSMTLCVPLPPKQMEHKCCLEHKHYTLDMSFILTRGLSPRGYGCRPSPLAGIDSPCLTRKVLTTKLVNARTILVYLHDRHTSRNWSHDCAWGKILKFFNTASHAMP